MYVAINGTSNSKSIYIIQSYRRENGQTSSRVYRKLGRLDELLNCFSNDREQMMAWAKSEAIKDTQEYHQKNGTVSVSFSKAAYISKNEERSFHVGYLFHQQLCTQLHIDSICRKIRSRHKFTYDLNAILTDLIYARILCPSSKMSSYAYCKSLLEPPKYTLHNVYRALSVLAEESDFIQEELYRNSNFAHPCNSRILYYDCTNYYFEIEEENELKRYGKRKENRPNPIVTIGLFMDVDGIPLAFDIFPGNRTYVITHSLKKMRKEDRDVALNPTQFKVSGSDRMIDLHTLDETDEKVFNTIYYKELPLVTGNMDETIIITYSPKYKAY